jgi:hypothetical protein
VGEAILVRGDDVWNSLVVVTIVLTVLRPGVVRLRARIHAELSQVQLLL